MRGTGTAKRALVERYTKRMEIALHDIDNSFDLNGDDNNLIVFAKVLAL